MVDGIADSADMSLSSSRKAGKEDGYAAVHGVTKIRAD